MLEERKKGKDITQPLAYEQAIKQYAAQKWSMRQLINKYV